MFEDINGNGGISKVIR